MPVLERQTTLPLPIDEVFAFFENAENLEAITPPWLNFRISSDRPIVMGTGALVDYRLRIRGFPVRWRTEIARYEPPHVFVDRQLTGPYRAWVHTHTFESLNDGASTRMIDHVDYELPRVPGRSLLNRWFVWPDLERIFDYREKHIHQLLTMAPLPSRREGSARARAGAPRAATPERTGATARG